MYSIGLAHEWKKAISMPIFKSYTNTTKKAIPNQESRSGIWLLPALFHSFYGNVIALTTKLAIRYSLKML